MDSPRTPTEIFEEIDRLLTHIEGRLREVFLGSNPDIFEDE